MNYFHQQNFSVLCDELAAHDTHLQFIISTYGYPPVWSREPSFATLIQIILEQQVSLASARAAFLRLQEKLGNIKPGQFIRLTDEELKECYFSRQKIHYSRHLANVLLNRQLVLESLVHLPDEAVRAQLKQVKGIGDWTADIFLMMALHRSDCFPTGDIALVKSIQEVKGLSPLTSKEEILRIASAWKPYRTIAAYLLWHAYIRKRNIRV